MAERVHYEADLRAGASWQRIEVEPFTRFYEFPVEQAAIDAARENDGETSGYRVRRVRTLEDVTVEVEPSP